MELLLLHHGFFDLLFFFFLNTYMHNTIQYTKLVFDSYPFSSLYKILSTSLDVHNNNDNHTQAPPLHILSPNQKRAQMRKPFKERQQFWCLSSSFFGFPSTHYQSRQSWFKMQEQLGCFICIPVCRDHIPRRYPDGHDEFQNSETRGGLAAHER
jgi:hypothetical protein